VLRSLGAEIDEHFEERPLQLDAQEGTEQEGIEGSDQLPAGIPVGSTQGGKP
jgi:multicomponent Na+:H+ antiporter subunit A